MLINICSDDLPASEAFYTQLFNFKPAFSSEWFINLIAEDQGLELAIIAQDHQIVPERLRQNPADGFYVTIVIEDVDQFYESAKQYKAKIIAAPEDTFYGQRRLLIQDPNGVVIDVSSPIPGFTFG
jgi:predicted enzyme related to lactoylglutathione lyase